jgi:hypothetical protein
VIKHPNLLAIKDFESVEDAQHFIKVRFGAICFFRSVPIKQYRAYEAETYRVLPFYLVSFLDKNSKPQFTLYRIVDIKPTLFKY